MNRYPVKIELLSETTFGNGESKNGVVNTDILLTNEGVPYFLGKTFKGCLKKSMNDILKPFYSQLKGDEIFDQTINILFGIGSFDVENKDKNKDYYRTDGKLKFSNFYLHQDILNVFNEGNNFKMKNLLDVLTDIRFSTKMNDDFGIVKKGSLRTIRVLKKGLVFTGFIECEDKLSEYQYEVLEKGIKSLKSLGVNKSRGKGQVKVSLGKEISIDNKIDIKDENQCNYLVYELNLNEPVKIGDSSSKYDYEESKLYITGSSVRGAIINKHFINEKEDIDILRKVYFSDAYPIYWDKEKRYSFPTPNIFVISKDTDKSGETQYPKDMFSNVLDGLEGKNDEIEERRVIKLKKGSFSYYNEDKKTLYQFDVKKDFRFHHTRDKEKENIFRYESISKNQQFYGIIDICKLDNEYKKRFIKTLKNTSIIYLGGSRTGGYGQTTITNIEGIKDFKQLKKKLNYLNCRKNNSEYNDVYLLSDVVLRDKNHQVISNFTDEYFTKKLGISKIQIVNAQIDPTIIKGFNAKWKSYIPQLYAMEKGSVIRITGNIDDDKIDKFTTVYHGDKIQDGLGRVIINPMFLDVENIEHRDYINKKDEYNHCEEFQQVDKEFTEHLAKIKEEYSWDASIKDYVNTNIIKNIDYDKISKLSLSQINSVIYEIDKCLIKEQDLMEYLDKLKEVSANNIRTENNSKILSINIGKDVSIEDILNNNKKTNDKKNLIHEIFNQNITDKCIINKNLLKICREYLYYMTKIIKLRNSKEVGDKHE